MPNHSVAVYVGRYEIEREEFWQAALEHHREHSMKGDSSVYHWASFLSEPVARAYALEGPKLFDEDFYYNDTLTDVFSRQSRTATTEAQAYVEAVHWKQGQEPQLSWSRRLQGLARFHRIRRQPRQRRQGLGSGIHRQLLSLTLKGEIDRTRKIGGNSECNLCLL